MDEKSYNVPTRASNDNSGKATAAMVLGIIGLIAWLLPIIGLPVTLTGLILGIVARGSEKRGSAMAGIVMSSIGLLLSLANAALGAYLVVSGNLSL